MSSSGDRNAGWPLNFQRSARDWPPSVRLWGNKAGQDRDRRRMGRGTLSKNWRWAGPATPSQVVSLQRCRPPPSTFARLSLYLPT